MKNATRYCMALLITGCAQQTFTVQNKLTAAVTPKAKYFIISLVYRNWAKKTVDAAKFVAAQKMLLKQKPANIRKWIARFYYFRHLYSAGSACVLYNVVFMSCPSIWATLSASH